MAKREGDFSVLKSATSKSGARRFATALIFSGQDDLAPLVTKCAFQGRLWLWSLSAVAIFQFPQAKGCKQQPFTLADIQWLGADRGCLDDRVCIPRIKVQQVSPARLALTTFMMLALSW